MRLTALAPMLISLLLLGMAPGLAIGQEGAKPNVEKLTNPGRLTETAPEKYQVKFDTSKGAFTLEVTRSWAPNGADRFYNLVKNGFYNNSRFFRVVNGFMVQFGLNGDPKIDRAWQTATIKDDPVKQSNLRGYITFAKPSAPNARTTQVFINYADRNAALDSQGFSPFGKVTKGMDVVDALNSEYGDGPPRGTGPDQDRIRNEGNAYLQSFFPKMDYIKTATLVPAK